jgi:hypothetical protein
MAEELPRRLREIQARQARTFDQQLQEFKLSYEALTPDGRQWLKHWLTRADELAREPSSELCLGLRVHVDHVATDPEGEVYYEGHGDFGPAILIKAIEAWERGEDFSPIALVW